MSVYTIDINSPDIKQVNGSGVTATSTNFREGIVRGGGSVTSPLFRGVNVVDTNDQSYGSNLVGSLGRNNAPVNYNAALGTAYGIAQATNFPYSGMVRVSKTVGSFASDVTGLKVGDTVFIRDANNILANSTVGDCHRVLAIIGTGSGALGGFVINDRYILNSFSPTGISWGKAVSLTSSSTDTKPLGYQKDNRYAIRGVEISVYNGSSTVGLLGSPASLGNRRKVHSRTAVRSKLIATNIRNGNWNIYTGKFSSASNLQNDFSSIGADNEVAAPSKGYGLKGEFVYRYGAPTAALADYDTLS